MKPKAILLDLDGTVANICNRGYYDWHLVDQDLPNNFVINLAKNTKHKIIVLTGRNEGFPPTDKNKKKFNCEDVDRIGRVLTEKWVELYIGEVERVVMKPTGSYQSSSEFKLDEYKKLCMLYDIVAIFDDNDKVCNHFKNQTDIQVIQIK